MSDKPVAWLHATKGTSHVITDRVKEIWMQVDPKHVENYTAPLVALPSGHVVVPVETLQNAKRYEWLRGHMHIHDRVIGYCVREWRYQGNNHTISALDEELDRAMLLAGGK